MVASATHDCWPLLAENIATYPRYSALHNPQWVQVDHHHLTPHGIQKLTLKQLVLSVTVGMSVYSVQIANSWSSHQISGFFEVSSTGDSLLHAIVENSDAVVLPKVGVCLLMCGVSTIAAKLSAPGFC